MAILAITMPIRVITMAISAITIPIRAITMRRSGRSRSADLRDHNGAIFAGNTGDQAPLPPRTKQFDTIDDTCQSQFTS